MLSIWAYKGPYSVEVSILIGTAAGLPLRYLLEKRGVFTTAIFWGVEYAFHLIFATDTMRYVGGVIGSAIGFYVKYQLDKKYVFVSGDKQVAV